MRGFIQYGLFLIITSFSFTLAASDSSSFPGDPEQFDMKQCVEQNARICQEGVCISGTPTNCAEQCRKNAEDKCQAMSTQHL